MTTANRLLPAGLLCLVTAAGCATRPAPPPLGPKRRLDQVLGQDLEQGRDPEGEDAESRTAPPWALELGVATISNNHTHAPLRGRFERTTGPASGRIYKLTVSHMFHEATWTINGREFHPLWELPFTAELIDERDSASFMAYSWVINLRWVDWPWNDTLSTTMSVGGGFHYTTNEIQVDRDRQEGHRSPLKFHWPIGFTFALPQAPGYQVTVFNDHSSGGTLFDSGGFDRWGVGFRVTF